jgi:Arc-like DNA binding domain
MTHTVTRSADEDAEVPRTIRFPQHIWDQLHARARPQHRSVNGELQLIVERALGIGPEPESPAAEHLAALHNNRRR